jgi:hypothetical protein
MRSIRRNRKIKLLGWRPGAWDLCTIVLTFLKWILPSCRRKKWYSVWVESSWNVMAHDDAREGKWRGNWRMEWVASTLHTTSEHGVSSITAADAHTSAASSRLNWSPRRLKWTRPFRRKTKSGFCACAITFQTQSTNHYFLFIQEYQCTDTYRVAPEISYRFIIPLKL